MGPVKFWWKSFHSMFAMTRKSTKDQQVSGPILQTDSPTKRMTSMIFILSLPPGFRDNMSIFHLSITNFHFFGWIFTSPGLSHESLTSRLQSHTHSNFFLIFSCGKQLYKRLCLSVRMSVCLSRPFYHVPITRSSRNLHQTLMLWNACGTYDFRSKGEGHRGHSKGCRSY